MGSRQLWTRLLFAVLVAGCSDEYGCGGSLLGTSAGGGQDASAEDHTTQPDGGPSDAVVGDSSKGPQVKAIFSPLPDMVPMPKRYEQTGGTFGLSGKPVFVEAGNEQCEIAADEIAVRITELGGLAGETRPVDDASAAGVYVLPVTNPAAAGLATAAGLTITANDPGPQGYVIGIAENRLVIIGSDNVGTLYGAMTLRQMMQREADGGVSIAAAKVYDKPDYHIRGTVGFHRGLRYLGGKEQDYREGINTMMRFKMNLLSDYEYWLDPRDVDDGKRAFHRRWNDYARKRGIYTMRGQDTTAIGNSKYDPDYVGKWECSHSHNENFYCWAHDDLTYARARRLLDLIDDSGFSIFFLHPVDGSYGERAEDDPETWYTRRCPACKARFGDDRLAASVNQFNIWAEVMREKGMEDVIFTSPLYPYSAYGSKYEDCDEGDDPECANRRRNTVEYWQGMHKSVDKSLVPMAWMATSDPFDKYASYFDGRPIAVYAHSISVLGYFGTWHIHNKTNFRNNPKDIFMLTGGHPPGLGQTWMNQLCSVEHTWNTEAPGSAEFRGPYYDSEWDHTHPKEVIEDWVPRATRALFGPEVGDRIAPVFQVGVLPVYIENPAQGIKVANKKRHEKQEGAPDPSNYERSWAFAWHITDSTDRMHKQVVATQRAWEALQDAHAHLGALDKLQRHTFMIFYRRMPMWQLLAKARYAARLAADQARAGDGDASEATIRKGLGELDKDRALVARILEETSNDTDSSSYIRGEFDKLRQRADTIDIRALARP